MRGSAISGFSESLDMSGFDKVYGLFIVTECTGIFARSVNDLAFLLLS